MNRHIVYNLIYTNITVTDDSYRSQSQKNQIMAIKTHREDKDGKIADMIFDSPVKVIIGDFFRQS